MNFKKYQIYLLTFLVLCLFPFYGLFAQSNELTVNLSDNEAGQLASYQLQFHLSSNQYSELKNGSLSLSFPNGFNLNSIDSITISDNVPNFDYRINQYTVDGQNLLFSFRQNNTTNDKIENNNEILVELGIFMIGNPAKADIYNLSAVLLKRNGQFLGGPYLSNDIEIISDPIIEQPELIFDELSFTPTDVAVGANISFMFEINNASSFLLEFVPEQSYLKLSSPSFSEMAFVSNSTGDIIEGINKFKSGLIAIPSRFGDEFLNAEVRIAYRLSGVDDVFFFSFTKNNIGVTTQAATRVVRLEIIAPNAPRVNAAQEFYIEGTVVNHSNNQINGMLVSLRSIENKSSISNPNQFVDIAPFDTTTVSFAITASALSLEYPEQFHLEIKDSNAIVLPPEIDRVFLFVDTPADLQLTHRLNGAPGVYQAVVDPYEEFIFSVEVTNSGEASVGPAAYELNYFDIDNNLISSQSGQIEADILNDFIFTAPLYEGAARLEFNLTNQPLDLNSNQPAQLDKQSIVISLDVVLSDGELLITSNNISTGLIVPGQPTNMLTLFFSNRNELTQSSILLERVGLRVYDSENKPLEAIDVVDPDGSGLFFEGQQISSNVIFDGNKIIIELASLAIASQTDISMLLKINFLTSENESIIIKGQPSDIIASFEDSGLPVDISLLNNAPFFFEQTIVFSQNKLANSFLIKNNPVNPHDEMVTFTYFINEPARIELHLFTITGEKVYSRNIPMDAVIPNSINEIKWDAFNGEGHMVMNGVYVAVIINSQTGETARQKIAIVK